MDIVCPRCKTSKYRNPAVRFMVNVCGHSLCTNCVELQFNRGSGKCEMCKQTLKKGNFRPQMFLSAEVERGVFIRKRILRDHHNSLNKSLKDFKSEFDFNNYLEEVETIIYNLTHGINVEETNARVEKYKAENEDVARINKLRERESIEVVTLQNNGDVAGMEDAGRADEENHEELQEGDDDDSQDASPRNKNEKQGTEALGALVGGAYQYRELRVENEGPSPPPSHLLKELGYLESLPRESTEVELAGGFSLQVACYKSLSSAMAGLFVLDALKT